MSSLVYQTSRKLILNLTLLIFTYSLYAEGTPQLSPTPTDLAILTFDQGFALSGTAGTDDGLCFSVNSSSEVIYFAFGQPVDNSGFVQNDDYLVNILTTSGLQVHQLSITQSSQNGNTYNDLVLGPNLGNGGYDISNTQYTLTGLSAGDYCIEFEDLYVDPNGRPLGIQNWDVSIHDPNNGVQMGRVWSKNWRLRTPCTVNSNCTGAGLGSGSVPFAKSFEGTIFALTNDNFVQRIDFANSGFRGLSFNLTFNDMGPGTSGNIMVDRQSVEGISLNPKFKIFINPPDQSLYTAPVLGQVSQGPEFQSDDCNGTNLCVAATFTKAGQIEIIIDIDGNDGVYTAGTSDIMLTHTVEDSNLSPCISWDGLDGLGNQVDLTQDLNVSVHYSQGVIHFMQYDAESNFPGWTATIIDPPNANFSATHYWDDSQLNISGSGTPMGPMSSLMGSAQPAHIWEKPQGSSVDDDSFGESRTINTWWKSNAVETAFINIPACSDEMVIVPPPPPPPPIEDIPTLGEWGIIILSLLFLIFSCVFQLNTRSSKNYIDN